MHLEGHRDESLSLLDQAGRLIDEIDPDPEQIAALKEIRALIN